MKVGKAGFAILVLATISHSIPEKALPLPDSSLYQLESSWQRDDGKTIRFSELRGQVRIVSMFFSHCANVCPMLVSQLKLLEQSMPPELKKQVGFVMITLDAEKDDPEELSKYRREVGLAPERWILLHGREDDTRELADVLGVLYNPKKKDGQIEHTGLITLVDREGRVIEQVTGISDRKAFLKRVEMAVATKTNLNP